MVNGLVSVYRAVSVIASNGRNLRRLVGMLELSLRSAFTICRYVIKSQTKTHDTILHW